MKAGVQANATRLGQILAEERAVLSIPAPTEVRVKSHASAAETRAQSRSGVVVLNGDGWGRFQELLEAARGMEADRAYQGSIEALIGARDLLTSGSPMLVPGREGTRQITDGERISLMREVVEALGKLEERRANVDAKAGRWLKEARDALARAVVVLMDEGHITREVADKIYALWVYEMGGTASAR